MNNSINREISFLDILNIASFLIAIENLNANLTQNDKADLQKDLANQTSNVIKEIHSHLEMQDEKINIILQKLEALK